MNLGGHLLPRILLLAGALLVLLTFAFGLWQVEDTQPRCLAGLFLTCLVPATLGLTLFAAGVSFGVTRRWWVGCLTLLALSGLGVLGGLGSTTLLVKRKLSVEQEDIEQRCEPLRSRLAELKADQAAYPSDLAALPPPLAAACAGEDTLSYSATAGSYLLSLPGSSLDIDGSTFFAGPQDQEWQLLHNDVKGRLEEQLEAGEEPATDDRAALRYVALRHQQGAGGSPEVGTENSEEQPAVDGGTGEQAQEGEPTLAPDASGPVPEELPSESDSWIVPESGSVEPHPE